MDTNFPKSAQNLLSLLANHSIENCTKDDLNYSTTFKDDQLYLKLKGYIGADYRLTPKGQRWWKENQT